MQSGLTDTDPDAQQYQIELLQRATIDRRVRLARALSRTVIRLARRAIRQAHPEKSEQEADLLFVATHYGADLSDRVRHYLQRKNG